MSPARTDSRPLPLVLFSGLGADQRVFLPQQREFPQLVIPPWRVPQRGETLGTYCQQVAQELAIAGPIIVGGISFGGIIAAEFARHVDARACLVISSIRSPRQLPRRIRALGPIHKLVHVAPVAPFQWMVGRMADAKRLPLSPFIKGVLRQIADADPRVVRWSIDQVFRFEEVPLDIPVWHIHGDRDPLFPLRYVEPDEVVQGGGHLLPLTHPYEVNNFLRRAIATFGAGDE
jgi:pimeloyl-ACP methyl ester carboxylesterase